jgi:crossover junction endodeoxyribonuclease RuvC
VKELTPSAPITLLGIDPGYDRVGWCIGTARGIDIQIVEYGCIQTTAKDDLVSRYQQIDQELAEIIQKYQPQEAAIESLFFSKNQKTAMHVSEARGVILSVIFRHNVGFAEYTPLQIKQAVTGFGKAEKSAVERMLRMQYKLGQQKILDDAMDAIGVMVTHAVSRKLKAL